MELNADFVKGGTLQGTSININDNFVVNSSGYIGIRGNIIGTTYTYSAFTGGVHFTAGWYSVVMSKQLNYAYLWFLNGLCVGVTDTNLGSTKAPTPSELETNSTDGSPTTQPYYKYESPHFYYPN